MGGKTRTTFTKTTIAESYALPPLTIPRRENSNMIQISTPTLSMWRGMLWSCTKFKVKVDKYFLQDKKDSLPNYILAASIQEGVSGDLYNPSSGLFKFEFSNGGLKDETQSVISMNPYNSIEVNIHQDAFKSGQSFYLLLEAFPREESMRNSPIIFGRSQCIA